MFSALQIRSLSNATYQIFGQGMKDALSYTKLEITAVFFCNQQAKMVGISKFVEDKTFLCNTMTLNTFKSGYLGCYCYKIFTIKL